MGLDCLEINRNNILFLCFPIVVSQLVPIFSATGKAAQHNTPKQLQLLLSSRSVTTTNAVVLSVVVRL